MHWSYYSLALSPRYSSFGNTPVFALHGGASLVRQLHVGLLTVRSCDWTPLYTCTCLESTCHSSIYYLTESAPATWCKRGLKNYYLTESCPATWLKRGLKPIISLSSLHSFCVFQFPYKISTCANLSRAHSTKMHRSSVWPHGRAPWSRCTNSATRHHPWTNSTPTGRDFVLFITSVTDPDLPTITHFA